MNPVVAAARESLDQLAALLLALDDVAYATSLPSAFNASIGGHVRHALDHFRSLLDGLARGEIDYDARARDPRTETVRRHALAVTRTLRREIEALDADNLRRLVPVCARVSYGAEEAPVVESTGERELMFCVTHAIHHGALIAVMAGQLGITLPAGFGVAPSTLQHRRAA